MTAPGPKPARRRQFPLITPPAVRLALVVGARTHPALARVFGIGPQDADRAQTLTNCVCVLIDQHEAHPAPDGSGTVLLKGETREPGDAPGS